MLEQIRDFSIFIKDPTRIFMFSTYIAEQKQQNETFLTMKNTILQQIVDLLCSTCEKYVFESAAASPAALTMKKYQTMKMTRSQLQAAALVTFQQGGAAATDLQQQQQTIW
jgi:hypothetical protein